MASSMNVTLTDELKSFVDTRTGDQGFYATPSEYLRDLIRQDMKNQEVASHVLLGLADVAENRFSELSILDIAGEGS